MLNHEESSISVIILTYNRPLWLDAARWADNFF